MELFYVGQDIYEKSHSMLGVLYGYAGSGIFRSDWGKVQMALMNGQEVHIRPANKVEMAWINQKLSEYLDKKR